MTMVAQIWHDGKGQMVYIWHVLPVCWGYHGHYQHSMKQVYTELRIDP